MRYWTCSRRTESPSRMPRLCYGLLTAIYEDELVEEPERREIIISNIEQQKELLLVNILGQK
jgi:hypothetical protein